MKGGLFLKILLGFWLTLYCIIVGLWLVFVVGREGPSPEEWVSRRVAPAILSQLAREVARDGPTAFEAARRDLPAEDARQITIHAIGAQTGTLDKSLNRAVTGPGGHHYLLTYQVPVVTRRSGPFSIPQPILIVAAIAGLTFSIVLAWYLTRPINLIRKGFDQLAQGRLDVRLRPLIGRRRDEIASLARDFDTMAARLAQLVTTRARLLHDVSHELRSPLARLQAAVGLARQDPTKMEPTLERIEREATRLDELVGEVLALARLESGTASSAKERVDLAYIAANIAEDARFEAEASGRRVRVSVPDGLFLEGNAELLHRAVENIVRNAVKYTAPGSEVAVALREEGARAVLEVRDRGPGIPEAELSRIFEPFYRVGGDNAKGFGLGLAIAQLALHAHRGAIRAFNAPGGGLSVEIALPLNSGSGS